VCGKIEPELAIELARRVDNRRQSGKFSRDDQRYIEKMSLAVSKGNFYTSTERAEMLRRLCQCYAVDVKIRDISSHRPVVGPVIVFVKKVLFQIMKVLLGPAFRQQRDFNAGVIYLLTDLCNDANRESR
jgi:hypothetical protein